MDLKEKSFGEKTGGLEVLWLESTAKRNPHCTPQSKLSSFLARVKNQAAGWQKGRTRMTSLLDVFFMFSRCLGVFESFCFFSALID